MKFTLLKCTEQEFEYEVKWKMGEREREREPMKGRRGIQQQL